MSSAAKGSRREYDVIDAFVRHGFWYIKSNRSGQCIKDERKDARIPGDVFVISPVMAFQIEVGGRKKILGREFAELRERMMPGFRPLVVLFYGGRRWYYTSERERYPDIPTMLEALKGAA